jgi:hypothetical protein
MDDSASVRVLCAFVLQQSIAEDEGGAADEGEEENFGLDCGVDGLGGAPRLVQGKRESRRAKEREKARAQQDRNEEEWWWWDHQNQSEAESREEEELAEDFEVLLPCAERRGGLSLAFTDNAMVDTTFARLVDMIVPSDGEDEGKEEEGMKTGPWFEWLDLGGNCITELSAPSMARLLPHSPGLTHLNLSGA